MSRSIGIGAGLSGRFRLSKFRGDHCTYQGPWTENMFLGSALDRMCESNLGGGRTCRRVAVGASSDPVHISQTDLLAPFGDRLQLEGNGSQGTVSPGAPYYMEWSETYLGGEGAVVGNVAEISLRSGPVNEQATGPNADVPLTRALVRDELGNPTTITVLADEFLRVEYTWRLYTLAGSGTFTVNTPDGPVEHTYTIVPEGLGSTGPSWAPGVAQVPQLGWWVSDTTVNPHQYRACAALSSETAPDPWQGGPLSTTLSHQRLERLPRPPYVGGSHVREEVLRVPIGNANYPEGIRSFRLTPCLASGVGSAPVSVYRVLIDPPIPKTDEMVLDLPITLSLANVTEEEEE